MTIRSRFNQYQGINAHFQSYAQNTRDGWTSFHAAHIIHLADEISRLLPLGYEVAPEASLQIRLIDPETGLENRPRYPAPDITIWQTPDYTPTASLSTHPMAIPVMTRPALEMLDQEEYLTAIVIQREGIPLVRLELLSPTNKTDKELRGKYVSKRDIALQTGTVLVEIDYVHESPTLIPHYAY